MAPCVYSEARMTEVLAHEERYACGARAAFTLARMMGQDVRYQVARNHASPSEQGVSLLDVQNALLAFGVQGVVLQLQLTDLESMPCPFIVHTVPFGVSALSSSNGSSPVGHIFIVTEVDKVGLHTIDPVTNQRRHWSWRSFGDQWSGYAISPTRSSDGDFNALLSGLLGANLLMTVGAVVMVWQYRVSTALQEDVP